MPSAASTRYISCDELKLCCYCYYFGKILQVVVIKIAQCFCFYYELILQVTVILPANRHNHWIKKLKPYVIVLSHLVIK